MTDWIGAAPRQLDELQAFDAMRAFLEAHWVRGGKQSADISVLLTNLDRETWADGMPLDIAQWHDFREAVHKVITNGG